MFLHFLEYITYILYMYASSGQTIQWLFCRLIFSIWMNKLLPQICIFGSHWWFLKMSYVFQILLWFDDFPYVFSFSKKLLLSKTTFLFHRFSQVRLYLWQFFLNVKIIILFHFFRVVVETLKLISDINCSIFRDQFCFIENVKTIWCKWILKVDGLYEYVSIIRAVPLGFALHVIHLFKFDYKILFYKLNWF